MSAAEAAAGGFLILCATRVPLQHRGHGGGSRGAQCALYYTSPMAWRDLAHFRNNNSVLKCGEEGPTTPFILQRNVADVFSWLVKLICFDCGCLHKFHWLERSKITYWFSKAPFLTGYISSYIQITLLPRTTPCCYLGQHHAAFRWICLTQHPSSPYQSKLQRIFWVCILFAAEAFWKISFCWNTSCSCWELNQNL